MSSHSLPQSSSQIEIIMLICLNVSKALEKVIFRNISLLVMKFLKRMFYLLFEHKTSTVYKWFERKKWRNICHGKLSSFHLEGMINEILPNSLEELFTKQSFRLYCRLFLPKNCFEQRPKTKKNGIYFWCKVYSADYFYGFPKSLSLVTLNLRKD